MGVLFTIAFRNLKEHKSKSLIIGVLIAMAIFVLTLGNSILVTAARAIQTSFIESYTGHVFIRPRVEFDAVTIGGTFGPALAIKSLPSYSDIYDHLLTLPQVESINPQISFNATIDYSEPGRNRGAILGVFGIEPESYNAMFPDNIRVLEGRFLGPDDQGVVIHKDTIDEIREDLEIDIQVGDQLLIRLFAGSPNSGFRLRRMELLGVYEYTNTGFSGPITFADASSARSLNGMVVGTTDDIDIDVEDSSLLDIGDDIFSDDSFFDDDSFFSDEVSIDDSEQDFLGILGDTSDRAIASVPDAGAWSYILLRLQSDNQMEGTIEELNAWFVENELAVEAIDWFAASGGSAQFNQAFQIFFYVVVLILVFVSVIIIMNTLVISVVARTKEIGTMRSLGAVKRMIQNMFIAETMTISLIFGTIGFILGVVSIGSLNLAEIQIESVFLQGIVGGEVLKPLFDPVSILISLLVMVAIGLVSSWYPVRVALKIQPREAMASG